MNQRLNISTGTVWEGIVSYSRAVKMGNLVEVAGTTASDENSQVVGPGDPAAQTRFILQKIEKALRAAGANLSDVVRTRIFVTDISRWEEVGRVHGEVFRGINPVSTMVEVSALVGPELLVEIEVTAVLPSV
jgi:enamine deaminase RidA (YjgF/YER057c/UK114 family)